MPLPRILSNSCVSVCVYAWVSACLGLCILFSMCGNTYIVHACMSVCLSMFVWWYVCSQVCRFGRKLSQASDQNTGENRKLWLWLSVHEMMSDNNLYNESEWVRNRSRYERNQRSTRTALHHYVTERVTWATDMNCGWNWSMKNRNIWVEQQNNGTSSSPASQQMNVTYREQANSD